MPERVTENNEISLNSVRYPVLRPPQPALASVFPTKITIGDQTKDSEQYASTVVWDDSRGGIGVERMDVRNPLHTTRSFFSLANLRYRGHLILPPLSTSTGDPPGAGNPDVIGSMGSFIYTSVAQTVSRYNNTVWSAAVTTLSGVETATDILTLFLKDTVWIVICTATAVYYSSDGTTWNRDTSVGAKYLAQWDGKLWSVDNNGELTSIAQLDATTVDNNIWEVEDQLPLQAGAVSDLFVGKDAKGEFQLYAAGRLGLYIRDPETARWVVTGLQTPDFPLAGQGCAVWRDRIYFPIGQAIWEYDPGQASIRPIGFDLDDGLPSGSSGTIVGLYPTLNGLLALLNVSSSANGMLLEWDGRGWQVLFRGTTSPSDLTAMHVSSTFGTYRVYFAYTGLIHSIDLPANLTNPNQISTYTYSAATITHETPWFDAGWANSSKIALRAVVGTSGITTTETVKLEYAINFSSSYTTLGTINTAGAALTTYKFPNDTTPSGTAFRQIRFRLTLVRGGTTTLTPDVNFLSLSYVLAPVIRYAWTVDLDLNNEYLGNTPAQLEAAIRTAIASATLVEFTFRDDTATGDPRNYYVRVTQAQGAERTGHDERGIWHLQLVEP